MVQRKGELGQADVRGQSAVKKDPGSQVQGQDSCLRGFGLSEQGWMAGKVYQYPGKESGNNTPGF